MEVKNDRLLRALRRESVDRTPIWIMRQAGRYLPEYRKARAEAGGFLTLCKTPELACEVALQPLRRFELDAAILFSDILTIPDAMGLGLTIDEGVGPRFSSPIGSHADIKKLPELDICTDLQYVLDAVRMIRNALNDSVPLIGFSGSPWTLVTYMVEGGSSKDFQRVKSMIHNQPNSAHLLLQKVTDAVISYLIEQVLAGAQSLMIFDTWGGVLATRDYRDFSLQYMVKIVEILKSGSQTNNTPIILFTKGGSNWLEDIADTGCDAVGLDWTISLKEAKRRIGNRVALQGNLDPTVLYASDIKVKTEVLSILREFGADDGHIFNLGHGIYPSINPDRVKTLIDTVHQESARIMAA